MIVDGKNIAALMKERHREMILREGRKPRLAIFYVGENRVIDSFVRYKQLYGESIGLGVDVLRFPRHIDEKTLIDSMKELQQGYDGMVVQLPLPEHMDRQRVLDSVPPEKDIDVLGAVRYKRFLAGDPVSMPPVVGAVRQILEFYNVNLSGKNIVIVGDGLLVGRPMADWMKAMGHKVAVVTEATIGREGFYRTADIIISGAGVPNIIRPEHVKEGVVLIDAGTSGQAGRVYGDIDPACQEKASVFSPVPGGVGPVTIAALFQNLLYNR